MRPRIRPRLRDYEHGRDRAEPHGAAESNESGHQVLRARVIDDHAAAGTKLQNVVSGHAIGWPAQLDDKHSDLANELAKKQSFDFDRDYTEAMMDAHRDLTARLESRLDVQSLADWKTAAASRTQSRALPEPEIALSDVQLRPIKSGDELTMKINQWAAETYPIAQKHLDTARTLENKTRKGAPN